MSQRDEVPLKIELLPVEGDNRFLIHSKREIQFVLHGIAQKGSRIVLYYDEGNSFILTTALAVDNQGLWLEPGPTHKDTLRLAKSKKIIFISSHQQVKVQFVSHHAESVLFKNTNAIYLPLPDTLLRLQRRDYYRLVTPAVHPLKCSIPGAHQHFSQKREMVIMDISSGGIALVCETEDTELVPGKVYPDCKIPLPDETTIIAAIQVMNNFVVTTPSGSTYKRAGCQFVNLDGKMEIQLQRYITQQQQNTGPDKSMAR